MIGKGKFTKIFEHSFAKVESALKIFLTVFFVNSTFSAISSSVFRYSSLKTITYADLAKLGSHVKVLNSVSLFKPPSKSIDLKNTLLTRCSKSFSLISVGGNSVISRDYSKINFSVKIKYTKSKNGMFI
jgi:hypothetical protein